MIAAQNPKALKADFENLLQATLKNINQLANSNKLDGSVITGRNLEPFIEDQMNLAAKKTPFEGTIVMVGGQRFPDIVAKKYYGVEVKSTTQNHWTTTGNSVLESTRIDGVERIYMMFGKLAAPIEFKCRPYEECLSEVVVTHSPRYLIDMDLKSGQTIFDKMKMTYETLRLCDPPLEPVVKYYKSKLKPGEELWWLGSSSSIIIRFWSSLSLVEKEHRITQGFVFFPEIFSNRTDKFNAMASWLVQEKSIVCPNMRDLFSAGGQEKIVAMGKSYTVPQIISKALHLRAEIRNEINNASLRFLQDIWQVKGLTKKNAFDKWLGVVEVYAKSGSNKLPVVKIFQDYIAENG